MRVTVLGCGGAGGVPLIGGDWGDCNPHEPKNRRQRASILVEEGESRILIDTSPDIRQQLLDAGVAKLDAILYTHHHADHVHGIDDVRTLNRISRKVIDAYGSAVCLESICTRFDYVFTPPPVKNGKASFYKPCLDAHEIRPGQAFKVGGIDILPFEQDHGFMTTLGVCVLATSPIRPIWSIWMTRRSRPLPASKSGWLAVLVSMRTRPMRILIRSWAGSIG